MTKSNGQLAVQYYQGFGGKSFDSNHYADAFRGSAPHHFGMQVSKIFTAINKYEHRVLNNLTYARGMYEVIQDDVYKWTIAGDSLVEFRITELLETGNNYPGRGLQEFRIAVDKGWMGKPVMIQFEDNSMPRAQIMEDPIKVGDSYYYTLRLETDDPNVWLDPENIQVGKVVIDAGTAIQNEMNQDAAGGYYNSQMDLQCQIGAVAREFSITDKVIRKELAAVREKRNLNTIPQYSRTSEGYAFAIRQGDKIIPRGAFITMAEAHLLEMTDMDIETSMKFGRKSTRQDPTTGYVLKTAPGWRQLVLDGHVFYQNGSLTAQQLEDYLHGIFLHRVGAKDRKIKLGTGEGGRRMFHQILSDEANSFLTVDTNWIKQTSSPWNSNALQYGAQFTKFIATNGIEVELIHDPMADDHHWCKTKHPDDPKFTTDSFRFDIYDFGETMNLGSNMKMVIEEGVDLYAYVANVVDPKTGAVNNGSRVASFDKGVSIRRERSGSLWVCDTSRCGSIIYDPEA